MAEDLEHIYDHPERPEFDIYATMDPAKEVGGDFYDFFLVDDDHLCLVMADVSGKGVPAALFMVIAKTLIKNRAQMGGTPAEILADVNDQLCEGNDAGLFVTVWLAILEISTGKGMAANAGHEHPVLKRTDGSFELVKYRHSPAVATMEGLRFREHDFRLEPGDTLYVYTDGVPDAKSADGGRFGTDLLVEALNRDPEADLMGLLTGVKREIDGFAAGFTQFDDITMLGLCYLGPESPAAEDPDTIRTAAEKERLHEVTSFLTDRLEKGGVPPKLQRKLKMAVEELFINIASYSYPQGGGEAQLAVSVSHGAAVMTMTDWGVPYDPLAKEDPDVTLSAEDRPIGGLGIYLVKNIMDEISYEYRDGKNILTMVKHYGSVQ